MRDAAPALVVSDAAGREALGLEASGDPPVPRVDERADTVPVVALSPPAFARGLTAGTEVLVVGRTRRRFWSAGGATRSQVEVHASAVIPARRRATATRALRRALATLEGFADHEE